MSVQTFYFDWDLDEFRALGQGQRRQTLRLDGPTEFLRELRAFCPKPGMDWQKAILVSVKSKDSIAEHRHPEHTVLFYVEPAGVPVIVDGESILPEAGQVIYLPPNVPHAVPKNMGKSTRVSIAMLVEADG